MKLSMNAPLTLSAFALATLGLSGQAHAQSLSQGSNVMDTLLRALTEPQEFGINTGDFQNYRCGNFNYAPIGSPTAESNMCAGSQAVGVMARPLLQPLICSERCDNLGQNGNAVQARLATNSITVLRNNGASDSSCDTQLGGEDWKTVLRTLYAGADGSGSAEACTAEDRVELLSNWSSLWSNSCTNPSPCTQVHHLYRPDEESGMGLVFSFLLGIRGYCNGKAQEDNDPIRRVCRPGERYCPDGDLGVVLPVKIPVPAIPPANFFAGINNTQPCEQGNFGFVFADSTSSTQCPDGTAPFAGLFCQYPQDSSDRFGCNNSQVNGSTFNFFMDGRIYNEIPLGADGLELNAGGDIGDFREYYRMHPGCKDGGRDNSDQLGCLVAQSQCSLGWGSMVIQRETQPARTDGGVYRGENLAISKLGEIPVNQRGYPLNQFLYINTINGFDTATGEEAKLVDCIRNHPEWVQRAVNAAGFLPFPEVNERGVTCESAPPQG